MQLLEKLLQNNLILQHPDPVIDFGISKLCCVHCREMLDAANHSLREQGIDKQISFAGQHDIDFTWRLSSFFEEAHRSAFSGIAASADLHPIQTREATLASHIVQRAMRTTEVLLQQSRPSGVSLNQFPSSSDVSLSEEEKMNV